MTRAATMTKRTLMTRLVSARSALLTCVVQDSKWVVEVGVPVVLVDSDNNKLGAVSNILDWLAVGDYGSVLLLASRFVQGTVTTVRGECKLSSGKELSDDAVAVAVGSVHKAGKGFEVAETFARCGGAKAWLREAPETFERCKNATVLWPVEQLRRAKVRLSKPDDGKKKAR
jgi:hypothetical protein